MPERDVRIRDEEPGDAPVIRTITEAAFQGMAYSSGTEGAIVDALRTAGALTVSLVAVDREEVVGHVAFSPVTIDGQTGRWYGLGPVSVRPDLQGQGIGASLIERGLAELRARGAEGCVLLGDPRYYGRFGFRSDARLRLEGVPPEYFQRLAFGEESPSGTVAFHAAFEAR